MDCSAAGEGDGEEELVGEVPADGGFAAEVVLHHFGDFLGDAFGGFSVGTEGGDAFSDIRKSDFRGESISRAVSIFRSFDEDGVFWPIELST